MSSLISIISINYNSLGVTCEMIDSVRKNSYKNIEVIVVDNASKENPQQFIESNYPEVKFIRSEKNLGFAGGNNLGLKQASGDYFFFLNNDAVITEGCIEKILETFQSNPKIGAVSPLICYFESQNSLDLIQYAGTTFLSPFTGRNKTIGEKELDKGQYFEQKTTAYAHGCAMMVSRKVIETVGFWPEDFFLYYEELDWCEQIRRAGFEIFIQPNAKVYHKESHSVGKMSALKTYYINRNRILFMRRNIKGWKLNAFFLFFTFFTAPKFILTYLLNNDFKNLKAFWKAITWNLNYKTDKTKIVSLPLKSPKSFPPVFE